MDASAKYLMNKFSLANLVPYDQRDLYQQFPHTLGKPKQSKPQYISPRDLKEKFRNVRSNLKEEKETTKNYTRKKAQLEAGQTAKTSVPASPVLLGMLRNTFLISLMVKKQSTSPSTLYQLHKYY